MKYSRLPNPIDFEKYINGKKSHLIILRNKRGMEVALSDYGARIVSILVPDKQGGATDVVLGFDQMQHYLDANEKFHGVTVGRFANRIANGTFKIKDRVYQIAPNNGPNALHGGETGFHNKVWDRRVTNHEKVEFYIVSPDGEGGFPGTVTVSITYSINENNELIMNYRAHTDQTTVINLTNHAYFNLNGEGEETVVNHHVQINASAYLPVNSVQIPTGEIKPVEGTAFDLRKRKVLGEMMEIPDQQLLEAGGYDHTFVLESQNITKLAAKVSSPSTGITLEVFTTEPGVQFYTGNSLNGKDHGKQGKSYQKHGAFCLETQHFPDAPNQANFPSCKLHPNQVFTSETRYKFSVLK